MTSTPVPTLDELEVLRAAIQWAIPWLAAQSNPQAAEAVGEAVSGRPELAGALLAALPAEELGPALQVVMEAYATLLAETIARPGRSKPERK
jgi:hypothetical protein